MPEAVITVAAVLNEFNKFPVRYQSVAYPELFKKDPMPRKLVVKAKSVFLLVSFKF